MSERSGSDSKSAFGHTRSLGTGEVVASDPGGASGVYSLSIVLARHSDGLRLKSQTPSELTVGPSCESLNLFAHSQIIILCDHWGGPVAHHLE
jgi:hypothetical protein